MDTKLRKILWLTSLTILFAAPLARANDDGSAATMAGNLTAAPETAKQRSPFVASYMTWLSGPKMAALDGVPGDGRSLTLKNYATVGYRVSKSERLTFTQFFTNPMKDGGSERDFVFHNPHVTLSSSNLWKNAAGTSLAGYLRYYMPLSHDSADRVGKRKDVKHGMVRAKIAPSQSFLDGDILIAPTLFVYRSLAGAKPDKATPAQRDWHLWLYTKFSVRAAAGVFPYAAYSNIVEHYRFNHPAGGGSWTKLDDDHNIELGVDTQPRKNLTLTAYAEYGGAKWTIRESRLGLIADLSIL